MRFVSSLMLLIVSASAVVLPGKDIAGDVVIADAYAPYFQRGNVKFDPVQQVLLGHRRPRDRSDPPLAWTDTDGRRGGVVNPLSEYPEADAFDIWDVAAGPQSVIVVGIVQAGERALRLPPRHVILTYDLSGALRKRWVVNPFHCRQIAADRAGSVYGIGGRIDGVRAVNLVRKYSAEGAVKAEFFPSSLMANGDYATAPDRGDNQFWVEGDRLRVYMADSDELFEFDLDGKLQNRTSLHESLARLAREHGGVRTEIVTLAGDVQGVSLLAQIRIWTQGDEDLSFVLARLFLDGKRPQSLETSVGAELTTSFFPMLGRIGDDVLFLNRYTATVLRR